MDQDLQKRIERAKWLSNNVLHLAMATVNEDGSPHNTPLFFMKDDDFRHLYWISNLDSLHSKNILRTGQLYAVLYEGSEGGGLYIHCQNGRVADGEEFETALNISNLYRKKRNKSPQEPGFFQEPNLPRLWVANTATFWVNLSAKDEHGNIRKDQRYKINREDIL